MGKDGNSIPLLSEVYVKVDSVVTRAILDETILVPISGKLADMQCIFSIETVGGFIWGQIDGSRELEAIGEAVVSSFSVEKERAFADLQEFITELHGAGLIQVSGS